MIITQIGRKKLEGHFAQFLRGAWGEFYKSWLKSEKFQFFRLILPIVNLTV